MCIALDRLVASFPGCKAKIGCVIDTMQLIGGMKRSNIRSVRIVSIIEQDFALPQLPIVHPASVARMFVVYSELRWALPIGQLFYSWPGLDGESNDRFSTARSSSGAAAAAPSGGCVTLLDTG